MAGMEPSFCASGRVEPNAGLVTVGTDVVDVERLRRLLGRRSEFVSWVFTSEEQSTWPRWRDPAPHLAGRFAAKEATIKALGAGLWEFGFRDVEVFSRPTGQPRLRLSGNALRRADAQHVARWEVSVSHSDLVAIAVVVATIESPRDRCM